MGFKYAELSDDEFRAYAKKTDPISFLWISSLYVVFVSVVIAFSARDTLGALPSPEHIVQRADLFSQRFGGLAFALINFAIAVSTWLLMFLGPIPHKGTLARQAQYKLGHTVFMTRHACWILITHTFLTVVAEVTFLLHAEGKVPADFSMQVFNLHRAAKDNTLLSSLSQLFFADFPNPLTSRFPWSLLSPTPWLLFSTVYSFYGGVFAAVQIINVAIGWSVLILPTANYWAEKAEHNRKHPYFFWGSLQTYGHWGGPAAAFLDLGVLKAGWGGTPWSNKIQAWNWNSSPQLRMRNMWLMTAVSTLFGIYYYLLLIINKRMVGVWVYPWCEKVNAVGILGRHGPVVVLYKYLVLVQFQYNNERTIAVKRRCHLHF